METQKICTTTHTKKTDCPIHRNELCPRIQTETVCVRLIKEPQNCKMIRYYLK